ncbi:MAG: HlyD family secretion protein [Gammaproteobacteria bacterium]|nr:HlyD family secretion protein [Gammaproteobacteria bacterium]
MSDQQTEAAPKAETASDSGNPIKRLTIIVLTLVLLCLAWYVLADRYTPYTSEARVRGYVVPIAPEIAGVIEDLPVTDNQIVEIGDPLLQIDAESYELAVKKAEADLEDTAQTLGAGLASVAAAETAVVSARTNLTYVTRQAERTFELEAQNLISKIAADTARTKLEQAKIAVTDAEARLAEEKTRVGVSGEENPKYQSALAALQQAQLNLSKTTVDAPGYGVVANIKTAEGYFAAAGQPVMTFISTKAVWIEAYLRENSIGNIEAGDEVDIVLDVAPGRIFKGEVISAGYGINWGQKEQAGQLPGISVTRGWLREPQRFPVLIRFDGDESRGLRRIGGQADVIVYTGDGNPLNLLGALLIRLVSLLSFLH